MIKHQGKKYDVEVDPTSTGEEFKFQVYSLTGVEPERQKILVKGGMLKDDADMSKLGLKAGQSLMLMGTASGSGAEIVKPKEKIKFVEDMTEAEAAQLQGATPAGLVNLGNTCYLNSTLQTLRAIPELQTTLSNFDFKYQNNTDLTKNLSALYKQMGKTQDGITPSSFLSALRIAFPQFAERAKDGHGFAQQDAEEAWSQIVAQMRNCLQIPKEPASDNKVSWVDRYMAGEMISTLECDDPADREGGGEAVVSSEPFLKLNCHIDIETNHLRDGILKGLTEKIEKNSAILGRDATYTRTSKISRLPQYLTVQFVRFFWRRDTQKKAKIMRKVTFPKEIDLVEFCTDDLRKMLVPVRDKVREIQKDEEDFERARKRRKNNQALASSEVSEPPKKKEKKDDKQPAADADGDVPMETYKTDADYEREQAEALVKAKQELAALVHPDLAKDVGANQSGLYELRGVVTHQGSSADSGHYTAYVKKTGPIDPKTGKAGEEDGNWWWFNDDKVSEVPADKIDTLSGGGESHSALILLYKAITLPELEPPTST